MPRTFTYNVSSIHSVYDGDTCTLMIDLGFDLSRKVIVRVDGVDSPELKGVDKKAGIVARDYAQSWLEDRHEHLELISRELDKYGRVLGSIRDIPTGETLTEHLIKMRVAYAYHGGAKKAWKPSDIAIILALPANP